MRHGVAGRKLNRTSSHRKAMLDNMVASLLEHERIHTTVPKAKEARRVAEHIITLGKKGGLHNIRLAERTIRDRALLQKLFGELKERYASRPSCIERCLGRALLHHVRQRRAGANRLERFDSRRTLEPECVRGRRRSQ